jgi:hypothetical protein
MKNFRSLIVAITLPLLLCACTQTEDQGVAPDEGVAEERMEAEDTGTTGELAEEEEDDGSDAEGEVSAEIDDELAQMIEAINNLNTSDFDLDESDLQVE